MTTKSDIVQNLHILVVEDNAVDRQQIKRTFAATEFSVSIEETDSSIQAIEYLREKKYDVALIDFKLPDGTALSVLKSLKETKNFQTPIIVITAHGQKDTALQALQEGAQDFLTKQLISPDSLERAIRYAIERHKLFHELQWSKERERRERELRTYQEAVKEQGFGNSPPIRDSENLFNELVAEYQSALAKALEESVFKVPQEVPQRMHQLATKLGDAHAGPKDVVEIHTSALKKSCDKETLQREEALTTEARILLVQLMGYLCGYYRSRNVNQSDTKLAKKKQS